MTHALEHGHVRNRAELGEVRVAVAGDSTRAIICGLQGGPLQRGSALGNRELGVQQANQYGSQEETPPHPGRLSLALPCSVGLRSAVGNARSYWLNRFSTKDRTSSLTDTVLRPSKPNRRRPNTEETT